MGAGPKEGAENNHPKLVRKGVTRKVVRTQLSRVRERTHGKVNTPNEERGSTREYRRDTTTGRQTNRWTIRKRNNTTGG